MSSTAAEEAAHRAQLGAAIRARTGIDEPMIERLVHAFYARVRQDELIGPVFAERIGDWAPHLARMCRFWSSVALMSGEYHGQPMQKHLRLPIEAQHFDRWLALFEQTTREVCPPAAGAHFMESAQRIARSLEMGIASMHGIMLDGGQRYLGAAAATQPLRQAGAEPGQRR